MLLLQYDPARLSNFLTTQRFHKPKILSWEFRSLKHVPVQGLNWLIEPFTSSSFFFIELNVSKILFCLLSMQYN